MSLLLLLNQPASGSGTATGSLSASETGLDGLVALAQNLPQGALAVQESGADTFVSDGSATVAPVTGTLAATESGADTFVSDGDVVVAGALSVSESVGDTLVSSGDTIATGSLAVSESGADTLVSAGDTVVSGAASASESSGDFAAFMGVVLSKGALSASEVGGDSFAADGFIVVPIEGYANATEGSPDFAQFMGKVLAQGALSISESGSDYARIGEFGTATGGTGETIYAHRMDVTVQQPKHTVTSRTKRSAQSQPVEIKPVQSGQKQGAKFVFICQKQASITVLTTENEAHVSTNFEYVL